jgi:tetratricopeptide (TPR) repeat protein
MNSCENVLLETQRVKGIIDDPETVSIQVKCLHKLKRTREAVKLISTVSAQEDNPNFKHWAGDLWLEIGEPKQARDAYMADIADGSNYWNRWQGLGQAFQALGEEEKASDAFSKALQENKKELEGIFGHYGGSGAAYPVELMHKLIELDKKGEVLEYCRYSVQLGFGIDFLDEEETTPEKFIDFLCSIKAGDIAVSVLRNTLAVNPADTNAWLLLGKLYIKLGDSTDAAICLHRLKNLRSEASGDLEKELTKQNSRTGAPTP